jgi:hypothetical protein
MTSTLLLLQVSLGWNASMLLYLDDLHTPLAPGCSRWNESMNLYLNDLHSRYTLMLQVRLVWYKANTWITSKLFSSSSVSTL